MRVTYLLITMLGIVLGMARPLCAQQTYTPPKVSAKAQKELDASRLLTEGGRVAEGVEKLEGLIGQYPTWLEPREALARTQYAQGQKEDAIRNIESSLAIDTMTQLNLLYTLGRLYEETSRWDRARACYDAVARKGVHQPALAQKAAAGLQQLDEKRDLISDTTVLTLVPMPEGINSPAHEALGRWTLDGGLFIFTRREADQEDIYFAELDESGDVVKIEPWAFNTLQSEGAHAISPDGKYFIYTACNLPDGAGSCDLYMAVRRGIHWAQPRNLGAPVNGPSWEGQPCFGQDGLTLFFSSGRPGGFGGRDIWYTTMRAPGKWSVPVNAGPAINTTDDEQSPYVHFDGSTMYFMRNSKEGLGGEDLYISRRGLDGEWMPAENMGAPVNSGSDEGALSLHPDGKHAVITRLTETRKNELYVFELPERFRALPVQALHIQLVDAHSMKPVTGRVEVFEFVDYDTVRVTQQADAEGRLSISLRRGREYGAIGLADGYLPSSVTLIADDLAERTATIHLEPLPAESAILVFQNILFETGSATLLPAAEPELHQLYQLLADNPGYAVEIGGHTDDVGDAEANQKLSEARARAVGDYLRRAGIDPERLTTFGSGESNPVADNATEEGRRRNRRTEIRLTIGN